MDEELKKDKEQLDKNYQELYGEFTGPLTNINERLF